MTFYSKVQYNRFSKRLNTYKILARIISIEKFSYFCSPESGMSDVWASWKDCKKIMIDGKSVDRFWVVFEKYFWWEKAEERWLIRKASVTDSCLILDTLAACCNIHWTDSILCSICKVFVKYLCCFSGIRVLQCSCWDLAETKDLHFIFGKNSEVWIH